MNVPYINPEIAARAPVNKSPIGVLPSNFLSLNFSIYQLFRAVCVGAYFTGDADSADPAIVEFLKKSIKDDLKSLSAERLRNSSGIYVIPGDGKKPIVVGYNLDLLAVSKDVVERMSKVLGTGRRSPLLSVAETVAGSCSDAETAAQLNEFISALTTPVKLGYNTLEFYKDILSVGIKMRSSEYEGFDDYANINLTVEIAISATIYNDIVDSDSFSPYLTHMAMMNLLNSGSNRAPIVYDPRKTATLTRQITSKYGKAKPRTNADGFAIYVDGVPISIPSEADSTEELLRAGDSAVDADGVFNEEILVEKGLHNRIIYVDWLNDILAYTSSTGKLNVISLIGTVKLTPDLEYAYLQTPMSDITVYQKLLMLANSIADANKATVAQYIDNSVVNTVPDIDPVALVRRLYDISLNSGKDGGITLAQMCGFDPSGIESQSAAGLIILFRAYMKHLNTLRKQDRSVLKIPSAFASQGIRYLLLGIEYLLYTFATKSDKDIEILRKEWANEQDKKRTDRDPNRRFALPNIKIGGSGLVGLLPHQSRIMSSMRKVPHLAVLPVDTGGGKSILSILDALSGIMMSPGMRPIISTKGNLVKGLVTEINRISQGGLNAIPLRATVLRRMRRHGIDTMEKLIAWVRSLPPNTIFINAYSDYASRSKIYKEVPSIPGIGTRSVIDSQYLRIMRLISFQMTIGDESHMIKNPDSNRSRGAYSAFSSADYRRVMSGTVVSNTVKDLVGQMNAISPLAFGSDAEAFCDKFGIDKGIIHDDATASLLKKHLLQYTAFHQAVSSEWSFMLPAKMDDIIDAKLTPRQTEFYNKLMLAAFLELTGKSKPEEGVDKEDDDDEDEEDEDEEEGDESFIAQAKKVFTVVEQFLAAPDQNEQYMLQADKPSGQDLISPKVPVADLLIDKLLREGESDPAKSKIIVFGINISAVEHFIKYSRHAKNALVYFAGDEEALRQYTTDDTKRILIAAETSIREGENLQMTKAIIKLQVPWAPGDYTQALARMYRPDPRGKYNRDFVNHYVISTVLNDGEVTLDGCKMARLISKFISNARLTYEGDPRWMRASREFNDLGLVTMNLDFIFKSKAADLRSYFGSWNDFVTFEATMNAYHRSTLAKTLEASYGEHLLDDNGKVIDVQKFIKLAMTEVEPADPIPGSKSVFTPWIIGSLPPDPDNLGYEILGSQPVREGDVVLTEFGPGIVRKISPRTVKVETYGGKLSGFRRGMVCIVPEKNRPKLEALVKDGKKWQAASKDPFGKTGVTAIKAPVSALRDNEPVPETKPTKPETTKPTIDVATAILNGLPALVVQQSVGGAEELEKIGWQKVDPYVSVVFRTWNALTNFLDQLSEKAYVPPKVQANLDEEIEELKHGSATKIIRQVTQSKVRSFFLDQKKKFGKKGSQYVAVPYLIAIEEEVRVAFDRDSHDPKVIQWLLTKVKNFTGVKTVKSTNGLYVKIFKDIAEARKHLSAMVGVATFDEADLSRELGLLRDELKALMAARRRTM